MKKNLNQLREKRKRRVRAKIFGTGARPRLSVFRSNHYTYCQLINDEKNLVITGISTKEIVGENIKLSKFTKTALAEKLGELIAKKAIENGIKNVVFDRGNYKYHGRVRAVAEGARKGGLKL